MEKYLHKCLDSLIVSDENMEQLEVLVINDGSKDSSSQIAHEYETKYPGTFRVIDKENGNYGSCINRGLKEATGKYVKVLDADDYFDREIFQLFILYLQTIEADLIISDFAIVNEMGSVTEKCVFSLPKNKNISFGDMSENTVYWLWHHSICYKTENIRNIDYKQTEGISYTDDEWIFKPMVTVKSIKYFDNILYLYLRGREGQTFDPNVLVKTFSQRVVVIKSMIDYYFRVKEYCSPAAELFLIRKLIIRIRDIYFYCLITNPSEQLKEMLVSLDLDIKKTSFPIYQLTNDVTSGLGWKWIKGWRQAGYKNTRVIYVMRVKQHFKQFLK